MTANQIAFYPQSGGGAGSIALISKQVVAGSPTSVTFSSIPGTYTHLRLEIAFTLVGGANLQMRFNGDSTSDYSSGLVFANSNAASALNISSGQGIVGTFQGTVTINITRYTSTSGASWSGTWAGSGLAGANGGTWSGTGPITSVSFFDTAGTAPFTAGDVFSLYGLA